MDNFGNKIVVRANAKLNLSLRVLGQLANGYHEIDTLMQTIDICDIITLSRADKPELTSGGIKCPELEKNIVYFAAKLLLGQERIENEPFHINIEKGIPIGAGLGGGSADAAAMLVALNKLYGLGLSIEQLCEYGARLGADVPFFLTGGLCRAQGIGEKITPLDLDMGLTFVVIMPEFGLSTPNVYKKYDDISPRLSQSLDKDVAALERGDRGVYGRLFVNDLEVAAVGLYPEVALIRQALSLAGADYSCMSGSGSAVYGVFLDKNRAYGAFDDLNMVYRNCYLASPVKAGVEIL